MIGLNLGVFLLLVAASIALASVEAAFYLIKGRRLGHALSRDPRAELVQRYLEDPPTLLMPVHIGAFTAHAGMTVVITSLFLDHLARWAMLVAFAVMVAYLLLFRLTLPYALVRRNPQRSLLILMPFFHSYAQALSPLVTALRKRAEEAAEPEAEREAEGKPEVPPPPVHDEDASRLEDSLARFSQTQVRQVMTPRPDIVAASVEGTVADVRRLMRDTKYSRIPLYGDDLDDIVGVVTVRDLLEYDRDVSGPVRPLLRPVFLVPGTKKITELLNEIRIRRAPFAVVIDEYGRTAGIVSVEDIVEELVGEIKDEYDVEAEPITVEADGSVVVTGRADLNLLEQALEAPLAQGGDVGTVGGLVATLFGRIPRVGEHLHYRGFILEVLDAERKRVNRVRFRRAPQEAEA